MIRDFPFSDIRGLAGGRLSLPESPRGLVLLARAEWPAAEGIADLAAESLELAILDLPLLGPTDPHDGVRNVHLLTARLLDALERVRRDGDTEALPLGIFASGHAAPAALRSAARRDAQVAALACHGGLIDLAGLENLTLLSAPLLFLADEGDLPARAAYQRAAKHIAAPSEMTCLAPGESPSERALGWLKEHLQKL